VKRFAFRLQRVLDIRAAREKIKLAEFGKEQQRLAMEREKLNVFANEQESQLVSMRQDQVTPYAAWAQQANSRYLVRIGRVIEYQTGRVESQSQAMETARGRYMAAHRDTQALEKLRESHFREWTSETLREEGRTLDEVGSRKKASGA
jgi:flagellar export protein FliJ